MTEAKAASEADFETKFQKADDSFARRAALAKKVLQRKALADALAAAKAKLVTARANIVTIRADKATALAKLVVLRGRDTWLQQTNDDDDTAANAVEVITNNVVTTQAGALRVATEKADTLATKTTAVTTAKDVWEKTTARLQGIRARLLVIRARIAANKERRAYWRLRTVKRNRRLTYLRKKRYVLLARLKRFRLRKTRAIEARAKA